ncbi:MAG: hypothetical protein Q8M23_10060, partial [Bacteroidales bacterium]|nr:hypothetical protein [Bacteroidales bacterium]
QIARPYGAGLFFSMLTVYFWTRLIVDFEINGIRKYWDAGGYVIANVLMMYNHYFSFLLASIIGLTGLFMMKRYNWHLYLISGFLSALLFVPHIPITLNHLSIGGVGLWLGKPGFDWIFQHVFYIFNQSLWVIVAVGLISLIGFIGSRSDKRTRALRVIALMWFLTPIAIGFLYSRWVNPVLQDSVVIFSFPFLLFFLFSFTQVTLDKHRALIVALLGMVLLGSTLIEKKYYRTQHFGEFKDVAKNIAAWDQEFGDINITCAISVNNPYYIEYYLKRLQTNPKFMQYDNRGGSDLYRLKEILETSQTPYFVYAWTKSVPYETHDLIRYYYPYIVKHFDYADLSAVTLYAKETSASSSSDRPAFQVSNNFETNDLWSMKEQMLDTSIVFSGRHSILLNPENEFGPTFQAAAGDIQAREGCMIRVSLMVYTTTESSKATLVFSLEQWEQTPYIWITSSISNYARPNSWSPVFLTTPLNKLLSSRDILKVYLWNQGQEKIYLDDIRIDVDSQPMR